MLQRRDREDDMNSILTKKQVKVFKKAYREDGREYVLIAKVRYDEEWGNGYNTFAITGEIWGYSQTISRSR